MAFPTTTAETFTPEETRALTPYFTNTDRPVFVLTNLPETVKGALFARYSRSAKSVRRLFLDEFLGQIGERAAGPDEHRGHRTRRQAVRARPQRVRRRLGRAARRRAHRVRRRVQRPDESARVGTPDGVPRAVDALRAVHRSSGRPLEVSRAGGARRLPAARDVRPHARPRLRDLRALDSGDGRALPREVPEVAGGFRRRLQVGDPRQGARHAARPAAGGDHLERRTVRHGPGVRSAAPPHVRASARRSPRLRAADADRAASRDSGVPRPARSAEPRRPLDRLLRRNAPRLRRRSRIRSSTKRSPSRAAR